MPAKRWLRFIDDVGRFLDSPFCAVAATLGWGPLDLFGCDRERAFARSHPGAGNNRRPGGPLPKPMGPPFDGHSETLTIVERARVSTAFEAVARNFLVHS